MKNTKEINSFLNGIDYNMPSHSICKSHTLYCLNWYSRKAIFYKHLFYILSLINIVAPLISSILYTNLNKNLLGTILASITSLSASLLSLYNVHDKWINYRDAAEFIKSQFILYVLKAEPYHSDNCHALYLIEIEKYMAQIHTNWYSTQKSLDHKR